MIFQPNRAGSSFAPRTPWRNRIGAEIVLFGLAFDTFLFASWLDRGQSWYTPWDKPIPLMTVGPRRLNIQIFANAVGFEIAVASGGANPAWKLVGQPYKDTGIHFLGFVAHTWSLAWWNLAIVERFWGIGLPWWWIASRPFKPALVRHLNKADEQRRVRARMRQQALDDAFRARPLCRRCGYDMRTTRDRCPECGWIPDFPTGPKEGVA